MATVRGFAERVSPKSLAAQAVEAVIVKGETGELLQDVLRRTGGSYIYDVELPRTFIERIRQFAEILKDPVLLAIADSGRYAISFEELQSCDPAHTRVAFGVTLDVTPEEGALVARDAGRYDARKTFEPLGGTY